MSIKNIHYFFFLILCQSTLVIAQPYTLQFKAIVSDSTLGYNRIGTSHGIATDKTGKIYVTDVENHKILLYTTDGINFTSKGSYGSKGSGDGQFNSPSDIAIDSMGRVFVCDRLNYRIQMFSITGSSLRFMGAFGTNGSGDDQFGYPNGITTDENGKIYVADFTFMDIKVLTINGNNMGYFTKFRSTNTTLSAVGTPNDIAINKKGEIFVGSYNYIQVFTTSGSNYTEITRIGGDGQNAYNFRGAYRLGITTAGDLIVGENQNHRIQAYRYNSTTRQFSYIQMLYWIDGSYSYSLNSVYGLCIDNKSRILLTSQTNGTPHGIFMYSLSGATFNPTVLHFNDEFGQISGGTYISFDPKRNIVYQTSSINHYLQAYTCTGNSILPIARYAIQTNSSANGFLPEYLHSDSLGYIYLLNNYSLEVYTLTGNSFTRLTRYTTTLGVSMQLDPTSGNIFIHDYNSSKLSKLQWNGTSLTLIQLINTNALFTLYHIDAKGRFYGQSNNSINSPIVVCTLNGNNFGVLATLPIPSTLSTGSYNFRLVNSDENGIIYVTNRYDGSLYLYSVSGTNYSFFQRISIVQQPLVKLNGFESMAIAKQGSLFVTDGTTYKMVAFQRMNNSVVTDVDNTMSNPFEKEMVYVYPNPFVGEKLFINGLATGSLLSWYDAMGRAVCTSLYHTQGIHIPNFPAGIYTIVCESDSKKHQLKVLIPAQ